jgi:creatinine amidohydrolase
METEVRYQMLRPRQIVERRKSCPIAYIPIGTLEWHGLHNPVGADTLQAETLAIMCAKEGGLAFPSLYYGESRSESLIESCASDKDKVAQLMELSPENFSPDKQPFSPMEQIHNYNKLLIHILAEVESLGFKVGVLVAGHYPLIDQARAAVLHFNKRRYSRYHGMLAWAFTDYLLIKDQYKCAGDHAAGWETSHLLASHPECVDMKELGEKGSPLVAVNGKMSAWDANAEFGKETLTKSVEIAVKEAHHRLKHPEKYMMHGDGLSERLWEKD